MWSAWMSSCDKIDRTTINLKVLSLLKPGDRLTMRSNYFSVQEAGWKQSFERWSSGDSRWSNLEDIKNLIEDAVRMLGTYMTLVEHARSGSTVGNSMAELGFPSPPPATSLAFVQTLANELSGAAAGLKQLRQTYVADSRMVANLDVIVQKIEGEKNRALSMCALTTAAPQTTMSLPVAIPAPFTTTTTTTTTPNTGATKVLVPESF